MQGRISPYEEAEELGLMLLAHNQEAKECNRQLITLILGKWCL